MAVYKVPQDVEAEDKLIGPFSFRQFIYLLIAAGAIFFAWLLSNLLLPLALIPLPVILFFGALALPLKKDQPMEIYLAAVVSFYLKPRKRLWQPDGIQSLVEITAPKVVEIQRTKNLSQSEAAKRLSYLADIVDTGGWAVRGAPVPISGTAMRDNAYYEAQETEDVLDASGGVAQSFDNMISASDARRRQTMVQRMHAPEEAQNQPQTPPPVSQQFSDPYAQLQPATTGSQLNYNPYPDIHQSVIQPLGSQPQNQPQQPQPAEQYQAPEQPPRPVQAPPEALQPISSPQPQPQQEQPVENIETNTSEEPISPDIINLANNSDLSIETIAHEAKRIHERERELPEEEVVISLH